MGSSGHCMQCLAWLRDKTSGCYCRGSVTESITGTSAPTPATAAQRQQQSRVAARGRSCRGRRQVDHEHETIGDGTSAAREAASADDRILAFGSSSLSLKRCGDSRDAGAALRISTGARDVPASGVARNTSPDARGPVPPHQRWRRKTLAALIRRRVARAREASASSVRRRVAARCDRRADGAGSGAKPLADNIPIDIRREDKVLAATRAPACTRAGQRCRWRRADAPPTARSRLGTPHPLRPRPATRSREEAENQRQDLDQG